MPLYPANLASLPSCLFRPEDLQKQEIWRFHFNKDIIIIFKFNEYDVQ